MTREFNLISWNLNKVKLKNRFPELTDADLIWRHESKDDLFRSIADNLGITKKEFEELVAAL